jgi:Fe-S-cluster containining protein
MGGRELDARAAERVRARETLKAGRTPLHLIAVAEGGVAVAEEAIRQAKEAYPAPRLACKEGCDWCCYLRVGTSVPEVARIADYLRRTLSDEQLRALRERIARAVELRQGKRSDPEVPCPLLVEHRCLAYPVRPLTCRGCNSTDAHACEAFVKAPNRTTLPDYTPQQRLTTFVLDGMRAGLAEAGLTGDLLELNAALQIALEKPDAVERWLAGAPVFAAARMN